MVRRFILYYQNYSPKVYKTNITGYLSIDVIERLTQLARDKNISRNLLFEKAVTDYLDRIDAKEVKKSSANSSIKYNKY